MACKFQIPTFGPVKFSYVLAANTYENFTGPKVGIWNLQAIRASTYENFTGPKVGIWNLQAIRASTYENFIGPIVNLPNMT
jgi:hypothetical protein